MLVLSRQRDEAIMIGDEIEITVVDVRGDKVRIGINAPPRIAVHRREVFEAIRNENKSASAAADPELVELVQNTRPGAGSGTPLANDMRGRGLRPSPSDGTSSQKAGIRIVQSLKQTS